MTPKQESDSILWRILKALAPKADDPDNTTYALTEKGEREVYGENTTGYHIVDGGEDVSGQ